MLKTILEIPQQNGVAERINQTLNERAKSMRLHAGLPKRFWGAKAATNSSNLTKPNQKDQVVLEDSPENLANNNIVIEHRLSSKINQSTGGSSNTSEGSKNSGSFEDSRRSYKEDSEDSTASEDLHLEQLYAKSAFLHGDLNEDIYMTQIEGFQLAEKEKNLVCKLKKILYGLKKAPRQWYLKFDSFMQRTCSDMAEIKKLKRKLSQEIEMKDFGSAK
ncbi:retrovirus-related pol polyprotein from transposon TNT 1-94 [Tanacetum coccineum]